MAAALAGNWSFEDLKNMGVNPEEITGQKAIELGPKPTTKNVPALRGSTTSVPVGGSEVVSPARPIRRPMPEPVGAPRGGGQPNAPALYRGNPQGFTFGDGVVRGTPNLPQTQATSMNKMNLPQVRPPQSFGNGRITPDIVINKPRVGLNAQPIDPTGGLVGAVYRAGSRATTSTDPIGNTTRKVIPGVEQMFGGYKDDATFSDARNLVRDAMKNKSGIKSHDNYNDPKTVFSKADAPVAAEPAKKMGPGDLSRMSDGTLPPGRAPRYGFASGSNTMIGKASRHDAGALARLNGKVKGNELVGGPKEYVDGRGQGYDEQVAEATRNNAIEKNYQDNKSVAQRELDLNRGNGTWDSGVDEKGRNKNALAAQDDFDAVQKRNAGALADATTRRGQDAETDWRKQQSTDTLDGRKFTAEQNRLTREHATGEGALNRKESQEARLAADKERNESNNATRRATSLDNRLKGVTDDEEIAKIHAQSQMEPGDEWGEVEPAQPAKGKWNPFVKNTPEIKPRFGVIKKGGALPKTATPDENTLWKAELKKRGLA